jgi:signal transduction histidine kinase
MKDPDQLFRRYQALQAYVGWTEEDAARVRSLLPLLESQLPSLVEDFYAEIARHPDAHKVFTGGSAQIDRLKGSLLAWLRELLTGPYDRDYVVGRWKVGIRHVEIGLDQVYTNVALSRLRDGMLRIAAESWTGDRGSLIAAIRSLNKLMDLDLAKIEDAYQSEYSARIQRVERLATLGQIAGGVAHELRNPLNVVRTSMYYLKTSPEAATDKRATHMSRIERSVERAEAVIMALTNFARLPVPEEKRFAVEQCVQDVLEEITVPGGIHVEIKFPTEFPLALADPNQIRIVLSNLIRNALDAMPSGGNLAVMGRQTGQSLEITVADTGAGIAAADLPRIMEPLYSTKARGMGLGLALSRMILDKNRGSLRVASEPGQGSCFTVHLATSAATGEPHQ